MFFIESNRLKLIPLTLQQLQWHLHDYTHLCQQLEVKPERINQEEVFQAEFDDALSNYWIPQVATNQLDYQWFTNWVIIHKEHKRIVGGIGVAGLPNEAGETEVGYGLDVHYRQQGIATEALKLILEWAFQSALVEAIIAHTPTNLLGSQRVLEKAGFEKIEEKEGILLWRKVK